MCSSDAIANATKEERFISKSNEILSKPYERGYHTISSLYQSEAKLAYERGDEELAKAFELASAICSMMLKPESANEPFKPYIVMEGKRSAIPDDFTAEELNFITNVINHLDDSLVQARFADLLWLLLKPKNIDHARTAINCYLKQPICSKTWHIGGGDCLKRGVRLARQIRDSISLELIEDKLNEAFDKEYPDSPFMHLWLAEIIKSNSFQNTNYEDLSNNLFDKAKAFYDEGGYREAREYLMLAEQCYVAIGKKELAIDCIVLFAECFEKEGDSRLTGDIGSQMVANSFYENALQAYRRVPTAKREELGVNDKLSSLRPKITEAGIGSLDEMGLVQTPGVDLSDMVEHSRNHVAQKETLELALMFYTGFEQTKYQELYDRTVEQMREHPLSSLFGATHMSADGRVVAKTDAIGFDGSEEENHSAIFNKMIQSFQIDMQITVQGSIIPALNQILSEYRVTQSFLKQLCYYSPIVPEGREELMSKALWYGFEHEFDVAIHLLTPQVEHCVRVELKAKGIQTSNIDRDGIENENGLSTLLSNEQAKEIFGDDFLFHLKALFTEAVGPNLRNEVAHGLLDDGSARAIASVYSWWAILKWVIRSLYKKEES